MPVGMKLLQTCLVSFGLGIIGCGASGTALTGAGGSASTDGGSSGSGDTGGAAANGGAATGGHAATGSNPTGGAATGGTKATGGAGSGTCPTGTAHSGGTQYCQSKMGNVGNGYHYEMWLASGINGTACMNVYGDNATFKVDWNMSNYGFVARVGLKYDETKTPDQIGTFTADYAFTKSGSGQGYVGIYGWMNDPMIEYYIIEDWMGNWRPNFTKAGTITVDGGQYDVYTNTQVNQPSIHGTATFPQWYSVRTAGRQCGHISVSEHFKQWTTLGMQPGKLYEVKLKVEGLNGSGSVDFTAATVKVN